MNEKLEEQLSAFVSKAIEAAEQTGQFVLDQAPDLIQQFIMWHTARHAVLLVMSLLIPLIGYKIFKAIGSKEEIRSYLGDVTKFFGRYYNDVGGVLALIFIFIGSIIVGIVMFSINVLGLFKILIAPKIYLIEYFL